MFKINLELGRINKYMKMKFGLILNSEGNLKLINKFSINGNDYMRVNPFPSVSIEISSNVDRNEDWTPNRSVTLNKFTRFQFVKRVNSIISSFKKIQDLFYYKNDQLCLNKDLALQVKDIIKVGQKTCMLVPSVIEDEETHELFEGVIFMINSPDNYCYLTFEELEFLAYSLDKINFDELTLLIINSVFIYNDKIETEEVKLENKENGILVKPEEEDVTIVPVKVETPTNTIPNI